MHETKEAGVYVAGLREDIVSSPEQVGVDVVLRWQPAVQEKAPSLPL